ncbi:MAG: selenium cofactor biosynthesis protein YqeC [Candidatus Caldatribacteriota bacterium]|nr:selenium cofactor biosynthesis protein YqeC [Candidatus Caldatribacteriota bacterium]
MLISEALDLKEKAFISLVGAGGKSTIFFLLARELSKKKKRIILTTTTHMFTRQLNPFITIKNLIETDDEKIMEDNIKKYFHQNKNGEIVLVHHRIKEKEGEKISGPSPDCLSQWWNSGLADYFIVEADGARGRPIKASASHEPVICESTTDLIGVIGIDALGLPLDEKNVFRPHLFSKLTGTKIREKITLDAMTALICHPQGLFKSVPSHSRCYLFINKVNDELRKKSAEKLAAQVLQYNCGKIDDIIIGSGYKKVQPVIEVIKGSR